MASFFSKFRSSKPGKKKNGNIYGGSNNSSQASLASRSNASGQQGRGPTVGFIPSAANSAASLSQQQYQQQNNYQQQQQPQQHVASADKSSFSGPLPLFMKQPYIRSALVKGSFQTIVELPKYVDQNEWLALNLFEFNAHLGTVVSMLSDYIDESHTMNAGAGYDYLWIDTNKQAVKLPASTYIEYTISWITAKFDDSTLFPTRQGVPFPPNFSTVLKSIYIQLFRIFAYIFHNQFEKILDLSLEPHFNSLFCHFASFGKTFNLLDRSEMAPLMPLLQNFESQGKLTAQCS